MIRLQWAWIVAMTLCVHSSWSWSLEKTLSRMINFKNCDVEFNYASRSASPEFRGLIRDVGLGLEQPARWVEVEQALKIRWIPLPKNWRCEMIVFMGNDSESLKRYIRLRGELDRFNKHQTHLFITSNHESISQAIYSFQEFQYHAHTVLISFKELECWKQAQGCTFEGHVFDTFGTFTPIAHFSASLRQKLQESMVYPDLLENMKGYPYTLATLEYSPFVIKRADGSYSGLEFLLAEYLARKYNFRINVVNPPDGAWGKLENGTWSGLIGHALYGLSNWSMSGIAVNPEREDVIDFTHHYVPEYFDWVCPLPQPNPNWPAIFKPFSLYTWTFVILATILAGPVLNFIDKYSPPDPVSHIRDLGNSYLFIFSALVKDVHIDNQFLPTRESPRVFLTTWWMFTLIIFSAYTGNLVAFMTSPGMQRPLDTPRLVLESEIPIGMYNYQGSTTIAFSGTANLDYRRIWKNKLWVESFSETYKKVIDGQMIFMDYRFALEAAVHADYIDAFGRPLLHLANYNTFRFGTAWAVQPKGMFIEALNMGTLHADMTGHLIHWKSQALSEMRSRSNTDKPKLAWKNLRSQPLTKPLTLEDLQGPFFLYLLCVGFCGLVFLSEVLRTCQVGQPKTSQGIYPTVILDIDRSLNLNYS